MRIRWKCLRICNYIVPCFQQKSHNQPKLPLDQVGAESFVSQAASVSKQTKVCKGGIRWQQVLLHLRVLRLPILGVSGLEFAPVLPRDKFWSCYSFGNFWTKNPNQLLMWLVDDLDPTYWVREQKCLINNTTEKEALEPAFPKLSTFSKIGRGVIEKSQRNLQPTRSWKRRNSRSK